MEDTIILAWPDVQFEYSFIFGEYKHCWRCPYDLSLNLIRTDIYHIESGITGLSRALRENGFIIEPEIRLF